MKVLSYPQLRKEKGIDLSRQHIARLEKAGLFPRKIKVSAGRVGWIDSELDDHLTSKKQARDGA
jgi:prophage regulatory protein